MANYAGADMMDPMKPGLTRTDDSPYPGAYLRPVPRLSGGGGLVSTLPDMVALVRSLLPGSATLLRPETIALMMTNQLHRDVWQTDPMLQQLPGKGHGLSGGLILKSSELEHANSVGELYWAGYAGTQWWISPKTNSAGVMMMQRQGAFAHPAALEFKRLAYDAIAMAR